MTPEEKARVTIDRWLEDAGWRVVDRDEYEADMTAAAIREGLLKGNHEVDYMLMINGKVAGMLEAKREEVDVDSVKVSEQVAAYARNVPDKYQTWGRPVPMLFKSNGRELLFQNLNDSRQKTWERLTQMYTPYEIVRKLGIQDPFAGLPTLKEKGLRNCQYKAVKALEESFREGQKRALMVLATGAGKTYTACLAAYRMLTYTPMRRVLFLVDRNNLGKQAENEFGMFRLTENGEAFNTIFEVNRLRSAKLPDDSGKVVISTIQRLFSLLKGEDFSDSDESSDLFYEDASSEQREVDMPDKPRLPHDYFDLIIVDECHRSIYGTWRRVLEYFDTARLIGLTATPEAETLAFFNNNVVAKYTLEQSIIDGVNVDSRIYRIKTKATEEGGAIMEGERTEVETLYTGEVKTVSSKETRQYAPEDLNRSIINPSQIRLILSTYRDVVYEELFNDPPREPNFDYLPKTLIFALNEHHATSIVAIAKEVFGRSDDRFVQKITYSAGDSNELIRQFRNDKDFRIAVTCTLVATGTDIKPLEVLIFMRDVLSASLYQQMMGRGVRTIGDEQLRSVTPNAISKDCFFVVDAVGVTEHGHSETEIHGPTPPNLSLKELLEQLTLGNLQDEYLRQLAGTLARLNCKADDEQRLKFMSYAGTGMSDLAEKIYTALDPSIPPFLPDYYDNTYPNTERKHLVAPITNHAEARKYLLLLAAGFMTTLQPGEDVLINKGFSIEDALSVTKEFEQYCEENRDEIEALRIIYNNEGEPINYGMLKDLENKLRMENSRFRPEYLWNSYAVTKPDAVRRNTKAERDALTNIIQLVRFAFGKIEKLQSPVVSARQYFNLWLGQNQRSLTDKQRELMSQVVDYIATNGACTVSDLRLNDKTRAAQIIKAFSGINPANEALLSLYRFVVLSKTA